MSKTLSLGIVISAVGFGRAAAAFGTVNDRVGHIGRTIDKLKTQQKAALANMDREWLWGGESVKRYAGEVDKLDRKIQALAQRRLRLEALGTQHGQNRADLNSRMGDVAAAWGIGQMVAAPVGAFARQDDALNALQVAMMDKNGQVNASYDALKRQAVELGNILPGTTADFAGTARALMEQGVGIQSVLGGGLKAASHLSVVLRVPAEDAGEMTAKLREAYKLSDAELSKMADSMQRAKFAFGLKPSDLMAASSYQAPMLNQLGITGIGNTNKMLAIQGMAAQVGLEGSSFGTNFSMMLSRLAKGPAMIEDAKSGMKAEAKEIMNTMGITFDFFDKKGNFAGLDHMVKELEKLKTIKDKMGDKAAMEVAEAMFGAEAGRPAMILAEAGAAGFQDAQKRMADQASLDARIQKTLQSSRNTWDALSGSVENFAAAAVGPAVQSLHPLINGLNTVAGAMTSFAESHPTVAKWIGLTMAAVAAATVLFLSLGVALSFGRFALTGLQLLPVIGSGLMRVARGAAWLGTLLRGPLLMGLRMAGQAVLFLGRALLLNPIGLAVTAIAGAAYLIYRNWDKIVPWFRNLWSRVVAVFRSALAWHMGMSARFGQIGRSLIDGLIGGVMGKLGAARDAIVGIGSKIKGWFADTLGIKSPSRVFMGFGGNIGEGAAIGIGRSVSRVKGAVGKLSGAALSGASAASSALSAMGGGGGGAAGSGGISVSYSPTIQVQGGGDVAGAVKRGLDLSLRELEQMIQRVMNEQARRAY